MRFLSQWLTNLTTRMPVNRFSLSTPRLVSIGKAVHKYSTGNWRTKPLPWYVLTICLYFHIYVSERTVSYTVAILLWRPMKGSVQNIKPPLDYMDNQALLWDLEQACSAVMRCGSLHQNLICMQGPWITVRSTYKVALCSKPVDLSQGCTATAATILTYKLIIINCNIPDRQYVIKVYDGGDDLNIFTIFTILDFQFWRDAALLGQWCSRRFEGSCCLHSEYFRIMDSTKDAESHPRIPKIHGYTSMKTSQLIYQWNKVKCQLDATR